ncbi:DUF2304 domain-containing protein [Actinomyces timonensis]|uniref:DUF2304 domain-containing protein n=1 Tax=Actinomyces timonensis TaxID=1288391 RepID=UPI000301959A|nr:DUF2304 domain-containing protein [Actinomyces timonensis]
MSPQIIIQAILVIAVVAIGWTMLRSPGGARHQASRRLLTLTFVLFAVIAISLPRLTTQVANAVGVGRGADLLLYALVIAFLLNVHSSFRRKASLERQITRLARRVAIDAAPEPPAEARRTRP